MNRLQTLIYNKGERLVPYVSHDEDELVRHRSSYAFFHAVITIDLQSNPKLDSDVSIVDLGFGTGYGCALLSSLPSSYITGVDICAECEIFARQYYLRSNVNYMIKDLTKFIPEAIPFDYAVSRGVLEHVPDGLNLIKQIKFNRRAMVDVPYNEAPGNEYHILTGIEEDKFGDLTDYEIFYEDLEGRIFDASNKPERANMIMVVLSSPELPKVSSLFQFPIESVRGSELETLSEITATGNRHYLDTPTELLTTIEKAIRETEVVLDVGCGIAPMNYFRPKLHILVEPWYEYSDIIAYRYSGDKSIIIIRTGALEAVHQLSDNSVDSIFLLDVIEHLDKEVGRKVIVESERVAREQIVIFTPLGFMPQHMEGSEPDGWGLGGSTVQEHRSGWEPEDFGSAWSFYICKNFHSVDFKGERLEQNYGAFYAVRNFERKTIFPPEKMTDFRRPLPSEIEAQQLDARFQALQSQYNGLQSQYNGLQSQYSLVLNSRSMRVIRLFKKILGTIGIARYK